MNLVEARLKIDNLPTHNVGGYEWECFSCHYHFAGNFCKECGLTTTKNEEVDERGNPTNHDDLISKDEVLKILELERD